MCVCVYVCVCICVCVYVCVCVCVYVCVVNNLYNLFFTTNLLNAIYGLKFHGCNYEMRKLVEALVAAKFD